MTDIKNLFPEADKRQIAISIIFIFISALGAMLHILFFEDISDDLAYRFVLTPDVPFEHPFGGEKVMSLADAIASQIDQWHTHSGRFLLHTITQMFAGVWGRVAYSAFTSLIIFVVEIMLWIYAMRRNSRYPMLWAIICVVMILNHGVYLIRIMAYGINYLWPLVLALPFMDIVIQMSRGKHVGSCRVIFYAIIAFLVGSTQEAFSLPLSAASLIVLCHLLIRRKATPGYLAVCICLWIGTALVAFAPGTLSRGRSLNITANLTATLFDGVITLSSQFLVLLPALALCLCMAIKYGWRELLKLCPFELMCFVLSMLMILVVHTQYHSSLGTCFFSYLVTLACITRLLDIEMKQKTAMAIRMISLALMLAFAVFQYYLAYNDYRYKEHNRLIVETYINSPDGIVEYKPLAPCRFTDRYTYDFVNILREGTWNNRMIQAAYGAPDKPIVLLTQQQMECLRHISNCDSLLIPGDAGFFLIGGTYAVCPAIGYHPDSIVVTQKTKAALNPLTRIKRKIFNSGNEASESSTFRCHVKLGDDRYKFIRTRYGDFYILLDVGYCPVVSVDMQ